MGDFTMPSLGADMDAGKVTQWLVKPGDVVHRGDIVAVVETDKSTIEVEIFENGTVTELVVPEGKRVPVGTVLAHIGAPGAPAPPPGPRAPAEPASEVGAAPAPPEAHGAALVHSPVLRRLADELGVDLASVEGTGPEGEITRADVERAARRRPARAGAPARPPGGHVRSSPRARTLADELGVDLGTLRGTGPDGAVTEEDVRAAAAVPESPAEAPAAAPAEGPAEPTAEAPTTAADRQAAMRQAIGALMARSKREVPHYYLSTTIDVSAATAWLEQVNLERAAPDRLALAVVLLKATARAVAKVPEMNGFFVDGGFTPSPAVHVGVAISLRTGGVIAPAIHDTDRLALDDLMVGLRDLVTRTRSGVLRSSEMADPTITVTNLGDLGVEQVFGVIYPPQVALVGFGRVMERPWAHEGMVGVRPCVTATLSADHRASDGHRGGRFLAEIDRLLQDPGSL